MNTGHGRATLGSELQQGKSAKAPYSPSVTSVHFECCSALLFKKKTPHRHLCALPTGNVPPVLVRAAVKLAPSHPLHRFSHGLPKKVNQQGREGGGGGQNGEWAKWKREEVTEQTWVGRPGVGGPEYG